MTLPVILLVGVVVIFVVGAVIAQIIAAIGKGAVEARAEVGRAAQAIGKALVVRIGREGQPLNYYVPSNLAALNEQSSALRTALDAVKNWQPPGLKLPDVPRKLAVKAIADRVGPAGTEILREEIDALLARPFASGVARLRSEIHANLQYPIAPPAAPATLSQPPYVDPVEVIIDEPILDLPYYQGRLRFLNRCVDKAHAQHHRDHYTAVEKRASLLQWHAQFNDECRQVNEDARNLWMRAVASEDKAFTALHAKWKKDKVEYEAVVSKEWDFISSRERAYREGSKEGIRVRWLSRC